MCDLQVLNSLKPERKVKALFSAQLIRGFNSFLRQANPLSVILQCGKRGWDVPRDLTCGGHWKAEARNLAPHFQF